MLMLIVGKVYQVASLGISSGERSKWLPMHRDLTVLLRN